MHQSVVDYDVAPATMTAVSGSVLGQEACGRANRTDNSKPLAHRFPPRPLEALASYLAAAGIAAGLVATWAALCVI